MGSAIWDNRDIYFFGKLLYNEAMRELQLTEVSYLSTAGGYEVVEGTPTTQRGIYEPTVDYDDLLRRIEEANETYKVITSSDGRRYEVAIFNAEQRETARVVKPSTSFSSLYKNPANALETALTATINPEAAYIYVGSFGNHPTGHLRPSELAYIAKTGRYSTGNGTSEQPYKVLDSVVDLAKTLTEHDLAPTHLSGNVEAGRLALALMTALPENTIRGAYLNGLDGISSDTHYMAPKLIEDMQSRIVRHGKDGRPGEMTTANIDDVKQRMPRIYHGLGRIAHYAPLPVFLFPRDVIDKLAVTQGFRQHNHLGDLANHAVYHDLLAALYNQETTITMQFNSESAIHSLEACKKFGKIIMDGLPEEKRDTRQVRLWIGEGKLDQNTDAPYEYARLEGLAFPDIMQRMAVIVGSAGKLALPLQPIARTA